MKGLARSRVWSPGIDADIKRLCSQCVSCAQHSKNFAKFLLLVWDFPSGSWQKIHIDCAGPFDVSMWLIRIDAYSKYGDAEQVISANGLNTVLKLREIFAMLGDPEQIVSDNGTLFTLRKFGEFCNQHGIRHIRSASYRPATKGEAERFVHVFKRAIRANSDQTSYSTVQKSVSKFDTECKVHRFLQRYRTVFDSTYKRTPSELLFGRTIRTTLDLIRPHV